MEQGSRMSKTKNKIITFKNRSKSDKRFRSNERQRVKQNKNL